MPHLVTNSNVRVHFALGIVVFIAHMIQLFRLVEPISIGLLTNGSHKHIHLEIAHAPHKLDCTRLFDHLLTFILKKWCLQPIDCRWNIALCLACVFRCTISSSRANRSVVYTLFDKHFATTTTQNTMRCALL